MACVAFCTTWRPERGDRNWSNRPQSASYARAAVHFDTNWPIPTCSFCHSAIFHLNTPLYKFCTQRMRIWRSPLAGIKVTACATNLGRILRRSPTRGAFSHGAGSAAILGIKAKDKLARLGCAPYRAERQIISWPLGPCHKGGHMKQRQMITGPTTERSLRRRAACHSRSKR